MNNAVLSVYSLARTKENAKLINGLSIRDKQMYISADANMLFSETINLAL